LLLSDFNSTYRNPYAILHRAPLWFPVPPLTAHDLSSRRYFQSRWDDWNNVDVTSVCTAARLVARTLYKLAHDAAPPAELQPNCTFVR
jgi:hypothetical protein